MILDACNIRAGYGRLPVVHGVDLTCAEGTTTALIGPNGAGKSTLLKAVGGVLPLMSGTVIVDGQDVSRMAAEQRVGHGLAFVPQTDNVFGSLTVVENLEMGAYLLGRARKKIRERIYSTLELFPDLAAAEKKRAGELSGGQRNMLAVARALMIRPTVLMLDEPTAGLAPTYVARVWDRIEAIARTGVAVLIVEQNVDEAIEHADIICVLTAGRLAISGDRQQIERHDLSALFLGVPAEETRIVARPEGPALNPTPDDSKGAP